ncbi:diguanylate cyclase response regulator [Saccharobesus litoralis]|uniref:diguanylate cyclase n=1 Tax=Saccharobesus litoralis TaxID=2172099 RepID=A0A2S0VQ88_9ALTE|nr:diguanylate cyclase [Saccharobesus litoralis]AWB66371.1 diguanylate cyclase response regulator [Saccharobesus litoralis]
MVASKVLIVDDSRAITKLVSSIAQQAGFTPVVASCARDIEHVLDDPTHFLCACVDYNLPDAPNGEAIDFVLGQAIPTFVLTGHLSETIRDTILSKPVIDYVPKETVQSFDYVGRLLVRLRDNRNVKILLVDDAKSSRTFMLALLARHNFNVLEADNGKTALKVIQQHPDIKVVVTDNEMPEMNGINLVSEIRKSYSSDQMAIIGISGTNALSLSARFLKNGANDYLTKPFSHEEFFTRIFRNLEFIENVDKAKYAANHDFLTDLTNRRAFFELAPALAQQAFTQDQSCCIAIMDLDKFKSINDTYGHDTGDEVLVEMAKRLKSHFREQTIITSRFGGEEFCVFFSNVSKDEAAGRLEFFRHHLETFAFELSNGQPLAVTTSIGLSAIKPDSDNTQLVIDQAISQADQALYQAKHQGRNLLVEF